MREHRFRQDVVGEPVSEPCQRVRRQRRDDDQVRPLQMRVRVVVGPCRASA